MVLLRLLLLLLALLASACDPPKELMDKSYSWAELRELCGRKPKQCVQIGDRRYFIDQGFVFSYDADLISKEYTGGYEVGEVVAYKNSLVALKKNGNIYLYAEDHSEWIDIGRSAKGIASNDIRLVALLENGELWAYLGRPGDVSVTLVPMTTMVGNMPLITFIPTVGGREIAFEKIGQAPPGAVGIGVKAGGFFVELEGGRLLALEESGGVLRCRDYAGGLL